MPNVEVRDSDGKLIHTYQIAAAEYGTMVTAEDVLNMAKHNVIDDELVSEDQLDTLSLSVVEV